MISATNFGNGFAPGETVDVLHLDTLLNDPEALLWVSIVDPTPEDLNILEEEFAFHSLAMEAIRRPLARPEIDFYNTFTYLNFYGVASKPGVGTPELQMISLLFGNNYLVSVQQEPLQIIDAVHENWVKSTRESGKRSTGLMLYSVLDPIVDSYFSVIDDIAESIDALEVEIFERNRPASLQQLFAIKKRTMEFRRVVAPERDLLNTLRRWDTPVLDRQTAMYLQDVYDHLLRVLDSLDNYRDLLGSVLDAHLSVTSNRLNQTMKTLTASSIILMGMTLVASIYGMNFEHIPELSWSLGYWWALGLMTLIGACLIVVFRRLRWF